ncbi:TRAF3-interacting JNK-activating modulator [Dryobates pubescens]|uniref:TRAF3-interacting JNK-activating modulator n=1 Tax=Dryobates pubescens TaxID=118200 RepID=A0A093FTX9_DRYPU|nr:TRAF3-interacting JNK-activating modulator [Dryobates pubescens]
MVSQLQKAVPRPRRAGESYDEKCERRQETRESLRRGHNLPACRHPGRAAEGPEQSPRQREFLRRRNLPSNAGRTQLGQDGKAGVLLEPSSRRLTQAALSFQHQWSCPVFPPAHSLLSLSVPLSISPGVVSRQGASVNTQGTQTLTDPSTEMKDSSQQTDSGGIPSDQLSPCPQEALHRELLLKQKMVVLQELFSTLLQASEKSWQGQLNEDKLRCKLRALENQLQACTQSYSKECMKKILIEMEDQKQTYEQKAKEALQKMLEDKLQTEQQLQNSQRSLAATREDLAFWKEHYTTLKDELTKMTTAHTELENSFHVLQCQLQQVDTKKQQLGQALRSLQSEHTALQQRASALRQDNHLKAQHITAIKDQLHKEQSQKVTLEATISHLHKLIQNQSKEWKPQEVTVQRTDQVVTTQTPPLTLAKENQNAVLEQPKEKEGEEQLKDEVQKRTSQLTTKENECRELRSELEALSEEYRSCLSSLRRCRHQLNPCHSSQAKRQRGHWIPLLVAVIAVAIATFLTAYKP